MGGVFCFTESAIYEHELFRSSVKNQLPFLLKITQEGKTKDTASYFQRQGDLSLGNTPQESGQGTKPVRVQVATEQHS